MESPELQEEPPPLEEAPPLEDKPTVMYVRVAHDGSAERAPLAARLPAPALAPAVAHTAAAAATATTDGDGCGALGACSSLRREREGGHAPHCAHAADTRLCSS